MFFRDLAIALQETKKFLKKKNVELVACTVNLSPGYMPQSLHSPSVLQTFKGKKKKKILTKQFGKFTHSTSQSSLPVLKCP